MTGVDASAPEEGLRRLRRGQSSKDPRLNRALGEILARGKVPTPDALMTSRAHIGERRLDLDYDGATFRRQDDGTYRLRLADEKRKVGVNLVFESLKRPVRHGDDGVVRGPDDERMFYYFQPRCRLSGTITVDGVEHTVAEGSGWYDHEFGRKAGAFARDDEEIADEEQLAARQAKVDQAARGRRDRMELAVRAARRRHRRDGLPARAREDRRERGGVGGGRRRQGRPHGASRPPPRSGRDLAELRRRSSSTRSAGNARSRRRELELDVVAAFEDQEFVTLVSKPSFLGGARGRGGAAAPRRAVKGHGFLERSGFQPFDDLDSYFKGGRQGRAEIDPARSFPLEPTYEEAKRAHRQA